MPFKSKAQQRFMFASEAEGNFPKGTARRWARHTKDMSKLPDRVKKAGLFQQFLAGLQDHPAGAKAGLDQQGLTLQGLPLGKTAGGKALATKAVAFQRLPAAEKTGQVAAVSRLPDASKSGRRHASQTLPAGQMPDVPRELAKMAAAQILPAGLKPGMDGDDSRLPGASKPGPVRLIKTAAGAQSPSQMAQPVSPQPNAASGAALPPARPLVPPGYPPGVQQGNTTGQAPPQGPPPGPPAAPPGSFKPSPLLATITTAGSPQAQREASYYPSMVPQAPGWDQNQSIATGQQAQNSRALQGLPDGLIPKQASSERTIAERVFLLKAANGNPADYYRMLAMQHQMRAYQQAQQRAAMQHYHQVQRPQDMQAAMGGGLQGFGQQGQDQLARAGMQPGWGANNPMANAAQGYLQAGPGQQHDLRSPEQFVEDHRTSHLQQQADQRRQAEYAATQQRQRDQEQQAQQQRLAQSQQAARQRAQAAQMHNQWANQANQHLTNFMGAAGARSWNELRANPVFHAHMSGQHGPELQRQAQSILQHQNWLRENNLTHEQYSSQYAQNYGAPPQPVAIQNNYSPESVRESGVPSQQEYTAGPDGYSIPVAGGQTAGQPRPQPPGPGGFPAAGQPATAQSQGWRDGTPTPGAAQQYLNTPQAQPPGPGTPQAQPQPQTPQLGSQPAAPAQPAPAAPSPPAASPRPFDNRTASFDSVYLLKQAAEPVTHLYGGRGTSPLMRGPQPGSSTPVTHQRGGVGTASLGRGPDLSGRPQAPVTHQRGGVGTSSLMRGNQGVSQTPVVPRTSGAGVYRTDEYRGVHDAYRTQAQPRPAAAAAPASQPTQPASPAAPPPQTSASSPAPYGGGPGGYSMSSSRPRPGGAYQPPAQQAQAAQPSDSDPAASGSDRSSQSTRYVPPSQDSGQSPSWASPDLAPRSMSLSPETSSPSQAPPVPELMSMVGAPARPELQSMVASPDQQRLDARVQAGQQANNQASLTGGFMSQAQQDPAYQQRLDARVQAGQQANNQASLTGVSAQAQSQPQAAPGQGHPLDRYVRATGIDPATGGRLSRTAPAQGGLMDRVSGGIQQVAGQVGGAFQQAYQQQQQPAQSAQQQPAQQPAAPAQPAAPPAAPAASAAPAPAAPAATTSSAPPAGGGGGGGGSSPAPSPGQGSKLPGS